MCRNVIATIFPGFFAATGFRRGAGNISQDPGRRLGDAWAEKAMEANYDEDLNENAFLRELQQDHWDVFEKAINEGWIVCVPRSGSFSRAGLLQDDFLGHILVPSEELPTSHFRTLTGRDVRLCNRVLTVENDIARPSSSHLLFEETFYTEDSHKYRIWCVERPLEQGVGASRDSSVSTVSNLRECVDLLWTEVLDKRVLEEVDLAIEEFKQSHEHLENEPLHILRDLASDLYAKSLRVILKDSRLRERTDSGRHFLQTIKVAVETYILHGLRRILPRAVSACTAFEDAGLNKTIKNLHELQLRDLGVRSDLYGGAVRGKLELSRLDGFATVLGKVGCLKRVVHFISQGEASVSSDDLLPVLIFLVIRAGLPNWIAQLTFMKQFRFSCSSTYEADEAGFLITSLEAAVEHVRSGILTGSVHPEADNNAMNSDEIESERLDFEEEEVSLGHLFDRVRKGDVSMIRRILSKETAQKPQKEVTLCHPLCSCESCERTLAGRLQYSLPTVRSRDDRGLTTLHLACLYGQAAVVDLLLGLGASVDEADADGSTPLHCAATRGHQNTLLLLLHANADPNLLDTRGNTVLHLAADNGHEACVKALLYFAEHTRLSLNPSPANANGDTPLHHASKWGYTGIVEILLEYGAQAKATNRRGQTPLALAHSTHISKLLEIAAHKDLFVIHRTLSLEPSSPVLKPKEPENSLEPNYSTERLRRVERLFRAITEGDVRLACYYLGLEGPQKKMREEVSDLCHPLCTCERCCWVEEVPEEHQKKPILGINACDGDGQTALHVASANGHTEIVQLLLDAGAKLSLKIRSRGQTPLHLACLNTRLPVARVLLNSGACEVDVKDNAGDTPLHLACRTGDTRLVELLVRHGASTKIRNLRGVSSLEEAEEKVALGIVRILSGRAYLAH